ncbi:hypothetical protein QQF64_015009 [Cirrhinus molitorella]|uniref:Uncharacterized protein n=1 Tax=Cirrhinus molitorella TaxID=172907 RepID=A0ABR3NTR0_9TELE
MKCSKLDDLSPPQMDDEEHQGSLMDDAHTRTSSHLIWPNAFLMQLVLLKLLISWISSLWISPFTELSQLLDKPLQSTAIYK